MDKEKSAPSAPAAEAAQETLMQAAREALAHADAHCPFGPSFFLGQLSAFVRDRCPEPSERLPSVELHLVTGEAVDVCHIVGVAPRWIALAVWSRDATTDDRMLTVLIPYETIVRVRVRPAHTHGDRIGFDQAKPVPLRLSPEQTLRVASGAKAEGEKEA